MGKMMFWIVMKRFSLIIDTVLCAQVFSTQKETVHKKASVKHKGHKTIKVHSNFS